MVSEGGILRAGNVKDQKTDCCSDPHLMSLKNIGKRRLSKSSEFEFFVQENGFTNVVWISDQVNFKKKV